MRAAAVTEILPAEKPLSGTVRVPGDKSISHRMALLAAVGPPQADSVIGRFSDSGDCKATLSVLYSLGVPVERRRNAIVIGGMNWYLDQPDFSLDCGRSGTTMRLMCGLLAGSVRDVTLTGDAQLLARPMERVAEPLRRMGARIETTDGRPPIRIQGSSLTGIEYELPEASAQVKSAILLAGLRAEGTTTVLERSTTRDHTERLLKWLEFPIEIEDQGRRISVRRPRFPAGFEATVPGDISSAAPLLAAAAVVPKSDVCVEEVGLNPTRTAFLEVLARMGAEIETYAEPEEGAPEPQGTVIARHGELQAIEIGEAEVPGLIDELPLVGVLGALAEGTTVVRGADELRVKESDRIGGLVQGLRALGADADELPDGFTVTGPATLHAAEVDSKGDHRLAMAFAVAALAATEPVSVDGLDSVADSFPSFVPTLESLR
ncbi:MAG: 3-phosphoshikimate 1-carboxyvinyltransferase [Gaiellales bacterium]